MEMERLLEQDLIASSMLKGFPVEKGEWQNAVADRLSLAFKSML